LTGVTGLSLVLACMFITQRWWFLWRSLLTGTWWQKFVGVDLASQDVLSDVFPCMQSRIKHWVKGHTWYITPG